MVLSLAVTNVTFLRTFLITDSKFKCTVTGKTYFIKGNFPCDSCNVIYLLTCSNCKEQHIGSAILFKKRFRIHKSDIKTDIKTNKTTIVVVLQGILLINVAVLIINMLIWKYILLNRYLIIINLVLRIYYGNEKSIGRHNYLLTWWDE